jgi:hypothetical protein
MFNLNIYYYRSFVLNESQPFILSRRFSIELLTTNVNYGCNNDEERIRLILHRANGLSISFCFDIIMSSLIRNVAVGRSAVDVRLSTAGVYSCIVIIIYLIDNTTFIYHIDPSSFNIKAMDIRKEIQKFIEKTIPKFNKYKKVIYLSKRVILLVD